MKRCSYKGCNVFRTKDIVPKYTLHQFPKDPERYKEWMILSQCDERIPAHSRYLCSKHFDSTKYVAPNPRRTILLSTSVPFPCEPIKDEDGTIDDQYQDDHTSVTDSEEFQHCVSTLDDEIEEASLAFYEENNADTDENDHIPTFTLDEDKQLGYDVSNVEVTRDDDITSTEVTISQLNDDENMAKRKREYSPLKNKTIQEFKQQSMLQQHLPLKNRNNVSPKMTVLKIQSSVQPPQKLPRELSTDTNTLNVKEVKRSIQELEEQEDKRSTFVFKGEIYIQMPKADYLNEKMLLLKKIEYYEQILGAIKDSVSNLDLS